MSYDSFRDLARSFELGIEPIRNKDKEIPENMRNPHYNNHLFTRTPGPKTIYLAPGIVTERRHGNDIVDGLHYDYSDRINNWYGYDEIMAARERASEVTNGRKSASYYEVFLRTLRQDENIVLRHILAGVNLSSGYSYQVYGTCRAEG